MKVAYENLAPVCPECGMRLERPRSVGWRPYDFFVEAVCHTSGCPDNGVAVLAQFWRRQVVQPRLEISTEYFKEKA